MFLNRLVFFVLQHFIDEGIFVVAAIDYFQEFILDLDRIWLGLDRQTFLDEYVVIFLVEECLLDVKVSINDIEVFSISFNIVYVLMRLI